ncbi:MAG TPA: IS66 family transposase [Streptosporangiaceae bacterium]
MTVAAGVVPDARGAEASLLEALDAALEANRQLSELAERQRAEIAGLREENARLLERDAERDAELEELRADFAVLQRMLFGRSSEKSPPGPPAGGDDDAGGQGRERGSGTGKKRGPGARAGRRDYSHLPRFEVFWDFPGGGYCCPECGEPFTALGDHWSGEQLDWQVTIRVAAHCRRRYQRACDCRVPATVMAPGPPKAIGKGLFTNAFIAMLLTERLVAGRSLNSLVTGLSRQGAEISPATLAGTCAQAGTLLVPLADAIAERSRGSWHLHADETTWRVFVPRDGGGPAKWWLWVFVGPDTCCFVMDPSRSGAVLARHAGIDPETGQLTDDADGGPRRLVLSSDFYTVYECAGKKADGLVNLYCWAHIRRHFVRAGDANPAQLRYWTQAWLDRIRDLYRAHDELMAAWQENTAPAPQSKAAAAARLEKAGRAWDGALTVIDETRKTQAQAPGLAEPAKKALATLDREWDGLAAHRGYPMVSLDNNVAERAIRGPVVTRKNARGSHNGDTARNAAVIWTVTATARMAGLNELTYLTACLDECGRNGGKPLSGPALERFLPWNASPEDLRTWAQPPPDG